MKRNRPVNTCLSCRKKRIRCNKARPVCAHCRVARIECTYHQCSVAEPSEIISASRSAEAAVTMAPSAVQSSQQIKKLGSSYSSPPEKLPSRSHETTNGGSRERGPSLAEHGGCFSYVGSTFWANPIQSEFYNFHQDDASLPTHGNGSLFKRIPSHRHSNDWTNQSSGLPYPNEAHRSTINFGQCKLCGGRYSLACVVAMLPDKGICEKLCNLFFATIFPLIPILHLPSFAEDFRTFWEDMKSIDRHDSRCGLSLQARPGFICLLSSILFASMVSASSLRLQSILGTNDTKLTAADMHFAAVSSAALTGFPWSPSIYSLAAYIFSQSQFVREEDFSDSQEFIGTAFRVALAMGLHRHLPEASFSPAELDMRRRLWRYILHLDVMSSASSGLSPLFIDEKMANLDPISYQNGGHMRQEQLDNQIDIRDLVASERYEITKEIRAILRLHFEDALHSVEQINDLDNALKTICSRVGQTVARLLPKEPSRFISHCSTISMHHPSMAHGGGGNSTKAAPRSTESYARIWKLDPYGNDAEVSIFCSWSAILLHLMVHKSFCTLYHPLFRDSAMALNQSIRSKGVLHSQSFLHLFHRLCSDPRFEPFHWMYPGNYQPLQPLSLLLADLLQHGHSDQAAESRGLVDSIFDLYQVDEGIVSQSNPTQRQLSSAGRASWAILSRTRRKAWGIMGWDSHTLVPSQRVSSDYCVCGERISRNRQRNEDLDMSVGDGGDGAGESRCDGVGGIPYNIDGSPEKQHHAELATLPLDTDPTVSGVTGLGEFDWQQWYSTMNTHMGMGMMF